MCLPTVKTSFTTENSMVSELVSTGSLKFGVSLKHFIVFAKPLPQLLRTNSSLLFLFETRIVIITDVIITDELANNNNCNVFNHVIV